MTTRTTVDDLKRHMYLYRNGVVADTLRRAGSPYRLIMGLDLPRLNEIAQQTGHDRDLATALLADTACRESQLMASMIFPPELLTTERATEWVDSLQDYEAADIFVHRLLRRMPQAPELLADRAVRSTSLSPMRLYVAARLLLGLYAIGAISEAQAVTLAAPLQSDPRLPRSLALQLSQLS